MSVIGFLDELEHNKDFFAWKASHKGSYLAHIFFTEDNTEAGYYNKDDSITTFGFEGDKLRISEEQQIFKKEGQAIKELDKKEIKVSYDEARAAAERLQKDKYPGHEAIKIICVLQSIEHGILYNFTFITQTFQVLNIKVDGKTKNITGNKLYSLMDMGEVMKGKSKAG